MILWQRPLRHLQSKIGESARLNVASYARLHKLTVLAKADMVRSLALVSDRDRDSLLALLCRAFCRRAPGT